MNQLKNGSPSPNKSAQGQQQGRTSIDPSTFRRLRHSFFLRRRKARVQHLQKASKEANPAFKAPSASVGGLDFNSIPAEIRTILASGSRIFPNDSQLHRRPFFQTEAAFQFSLQVGQSGEKSWKVESRRQVEIDAANILNDQIVMRNSLKTARHCVNFVAVLKALREEIEFNLNAVQVYQQKLKEEWDLNLEAQNNAKIWEKIPEVQPTLETAPTSATLPAAGLSALAAATRAYFDHLKLKDDGNWEVQLWGKRGEDAMEEKEMEARTKFAIASSTQEQARPQNQNEAAASPLPLMNASSPFKLPLYQSKTMDTRGQARPVITQLSTFPSTHSNSLKKPDHHLLFSHSAATFHPKSEKHSPASFQLQPPARASPPTLSTSNSLSSTFLTEAPSNYSSAAKLDLAAAISQPQFTNQLPLETWKKAQIRPASASPTSALSQYPPAHPPPKFGASNAGDAQSMSMGMRQALSLSQLHTTNAPPSASAPAHSALFGNSLPQPPVFGSRPSSALVSMPANASPPAIAPAPSATNSSQNTAGLKGEAGGNWSPDEIEQKSVDLIRRLAPALIPDFRYYSQLLERLAVADFAEDELQSALQFVCEQWRSLMGLLIAHNLAPFRSRPPAPSSNANVSPGERRFWLALPRLLEQFFRFFSLLVESLLVRRKAEVEARESEDRKKFQQLKDSLNDELALVDRENEEDSKAEKAEKKQKTPLNSARKAKAAAGGASAGPAESAGESSFGSGKNSNFHLILENDALKKSLSKLQRENEGLLLQIFRLKNLVKKTAATNNNIIINLNPLSGGKSLKLSNGANPSAEDGDDQSTPSLHPGAAIEIIDNEHHPIATQNILLITEDLDAKVKKDTRAVSAALEGLEGVIFELEELRGDKRQLLALMENNIHFIQNKDVLLSVERQKYNELYEENLQLMEANKAAAEELRAKTRALEKKEWKLGYDFQRMKEKFIQFMNIFNLARFDFQYFFKKEQLMRAMAGKDARSNQSPRSEEDEEERLMRDQEENAEQAKARATEKAEKKRERMRAAGEIDPNFPSEFPMFADSSEDEDDSYFHFHTNLASVNPVNNETQLANAATDPNIQIESNTLEPPSHEDLKRTTKNLAKFNQDLFFQLYQRINEIEDQNLLKQLLYLSVHKNIYYIGVLKRRNLRRSQVKNNEWINNNKLWRPFWSMLLKSIFNKKKHGRNKRKRRRKGRRSQKEKAADALKKLQQSGIIGEAAAAMQAAESANGSDFEGALSAPETVMSLLQQRAASPKTPAKSEEKVDLLNVNEPNHHLFALQTPAATPNPTQVRPSTPTLAASSTNASGSRSSLSPPLHKTHFSVDLSVVKTALNSVQAKADDKEADKGSARSRGSLSARPATPIERRNEAKREGSGKK